MSAHTSLGYAGLLSPAWLGNAPESGAVLVYRPDPVASYEGGIALLPQGVAGWTLHATITRCTIMPATTGSGGDKPLQPDPGGARIEQEIVAFVPAEIGIQTVEDVGEQNADVILFEGSYFRVMRAFVDNEETAMNSFSAARIQPRNLPGNLP